MIQTINLVGITGKARAGKDTLARQLMRLGYRQDAFAHGVKEVTAKLAGEPVSHFYDDDAKEAHSANLGMTRRRAMQAVGNSMREAIGPNVWIRPLFANWEESGRKPTVVSDVRYPNEADAIRRAGGLIIRVERPNLIGLQGEEAAHASEIPLPDHLVDVVIVNDKTENYLFEVVQAILARV